MPADTRLLIVPNSQYVQDPTVTALRAAAGRGLVVGIIGEQSLTLAPTGGRREDAEVPGARRIPLGTPQEYQQQFDSWFQTSGIERELVALDAAGRSAWGIELRTARENGQRLAYLVNLMRQPIKVTLRAKVADAQLRDWRTEITVSNEVVLAPRQLLFGSF